MPKGLKTSTIDTPRPRRNETEAVADPTLGAWLLAAALLASTVHTIYFLQTSKYLSSIGLADEYIMPAMSLGQFAEIAVLGVLGLVSLVCMLFLMPRLPAARTITFADLPRVFRGNAGVRAGIALTDLKRYRKRKFRVLGPKETAAP
jgi:hypothetical protein